MSNVNLQCITVDGRVFVAKDSLPVIQDAIPPGNRVVLVADRGWIFAGDIERKDGRIKLTRVVHVRSWSSVGFDGMIAAPGGGNVVIKKLSAPVDMPEDAELFCIPVADDWGIK